MGGTFIQKCLMVVGVEGFHWKRGGGKLIWGVKLLEIKF